MRLKDAILVLGFTLMATPALAYVGPGLGLGAIGAVLGVILAVFLAVFALFLGPVKRLFGRKKDRKKPNVGK